jgi:hypothetical protein
MLVSIFHAIQLLIGKENDKIIFESLFFLALSKKLDKIAQYKKYFKK